MTVDHECIHESGVLPENGCSASLPGRASSLALLISGLGLLAGCATKFELLPAPGDREVSQYPPPGTEVFVRSGERIAASGQLMIGPELTVRRTTIFGTRKAESVLYCAFTVYPGSARRSGIFRSESREAECFGPFRAIISKRDGTTGNSTWGCNDERPGQICADPATGDYLLVVENEVIELDATASNLHVDPVVTAAGDLEWELIYERRDGDMLVFILREFDREPDPSGSTRSIRHDYGSSDVIQLHGRRLRIISADDRGIRYRSEQVQ